MGADPSCGCNLMNMPLVSPERDLPTPNEESRMFRFSAASALMLALMATPVFAASTQAATHKRGAVRRVSHRIGHRIAFDFMPPLLSLPVIHRATIPLSEELSAGSARRFADATSPV